ncbi:hypothetical protein ACR5KS_01985 [Leucobacter sp. W1153]|uniref:hypothetical protein n=1 Tax=Leucobacter sp. W1153 TaxID=3439064 RepID=UPI003F394681
MCDAECPFCGSRKKKTREHRIPKSWKPYLHLVPEVVSTVAVKGVIGDPSGSSRSQLDVQYGGICAECNNGWLRELDEAAMARMLNLARFMTQEIPAGEVLPVMRSVVRAALMTAWGKRDIGAYPAASFVEFFETRLPPSGAYVFMGFTDWFSMHAAGHHALWPVEEPGGAHLVSWGLDRLFIVVIFPKDGDQVSATEVASSLRKRAKGLLKQVWPNPTGRRLKIPSQNAHRIDREVVSGLTQIKPLLFGEEPLVFNLDPDRTTARYDGMSERELIDTYVTRPSKRPPEL